MNNNLKRKKFFCIITLVIVIAFHSAFLYGEKWWNVYFTSPHKKESAEQMSDPETALIIKIRNTKKSFYGAFYDITSQSIIKEIIDADRRKVDVKLVLERDNLRKKETKELINSGIKIIPDNRKGLMHNKFAIIDDLIVWTGSMNLTGNDAFKNNNNVIEIHSEELAKIYLEEFNEMFNCKIFGNRKEQTIFPSFRKKYYVKIGDTDINVYFSPEDNIERIITERIKKAKQTIHFLAFAFTSNKLSDEMILLHKKGVSVHGIIEKIGSNSKDSKYVKLKLEGIDVKLDKNRHKMHHKVIIIDERITITGSYNFSKSANEKNDENILILHNEDIAKLYLEEFFKLFK